MMPRTVPLENGIEGGVVVNVKELREIARTHRNLMRMAASLEEAFEDKVGWSKGCSRRRGKVDKFDGEHIFHCFKLPKNNSTGNRMECLIGNCPLGREES